VTKLDVDPPRSSGARASGAATEVGLQTLLNDDAGNGGVRGTVRIAPAVLIELIGLAASNVPGVVSFQPRRRVERILPRGGQGSTADPDATVSSFEGGGVRVHVNGDRIDADISIVILPDVNILELSRDIQRQVGIAVGQMLGMTVNEVNVYVAGVAATSNAER